MTDTETSSPLEAKTPQPEDTGRRRAWLAAWLARRPDVMATALEIYHRLLRGAAARWERRAGRAGLTLAGAALLLALGAGALRPPDVRAGAISVDSGVVTVANDNKCSLVEAIINANSDNQIFTAAGECAAGSGADTITLPGGYFNLLSAYGGSAYYSNNGLPSISSAITIEGNGATIERDANASPFRMISVTGSGKLTLNNTTLSGGNTSVWGGGLYVYAGGEATLSDSVIFGNKAGQGGGVASKFGSVTLINSTVGGNQVLYNGGGILINLANLTVIDSTISSNEAGFGGGGIAVAHGNTAEVVRSTVRGNSAKWGGGIYLLGGTAEIENSTISDNYAMTSGGGIYNRGGRSDITQTTITSNTAAGSGGGLLQGHSASQGSVYRSLISGNNATAGEEIYRTADAGPLAVGANNVFGHAGLSNADAFVNFAPGTSDYSATSDDGNVMLSSILNSSLDNNGGPTFTHALPPDSPAIDFVPSADCATITDQRSFGRNVDGDGQPSAAECDSGAFEFAAILATPSPVASPTPTATTTPTATATQPATPSETPVTGGATATPTPTATATTTGEATAAVTPSPSPTPSATVSPADEWQLFLPLALGGVSR